MPTVNLSFSGWLTNANVEKATDTTGQVVDVSMMPGEILAKKLNAGELFISLGDHLYTSGKAEVEIFDVEAERKIDLGITNPKSE